MSKCKGCGAEIIWIETRGGKKHPVDAKPRKMWVKLAEKWFLMDCYETHFATCPKSKDFSGKGKI